MTEHETEAECLALIAKAQQLHTLAKNCHCKREKRRLIKEANNLETLASETLEKINAKANTTATSNNE